MTPDTLNTVQAVVAVCSLPLGTVIVGVVVRVGLALAKRAGVDTTKIDVSNMENQIDASLQKGVTDFLPLIEANGWNSPVVHDAVLAAGVSYFKQRFPDRVAQIAEAAGVLFGKPGEDAATHSAVTDTLQARMPMALQQASVSPATPPAPVLAPVGTLVAQLVPVLSQPDAGTGTMQAGVTSLGKVS